MQDLKTLLFPFFQLRSLFILLLSVPLLVFAQGPPWGGGGGDRAQMNMGRFYGKVVDDEGKGVAYASVQLIGMQFDTLTRSRKEAILAGQLTASNGDFDLKNLPVFGEFTLKITVLGYADLDQKVSFGLTRETMKERMGGGGARPGGGRPGGGGNWASAMGGMNFDIDLGNIELTTQSLTLGEVVIEGEGTTVTLALDRKIYKMERNIVAAGGTAEDALRNVPSLNVDIDGNLSMRNASPQLFVDGRPTTLTLDQIPADAIESVEVITNPSAKYDASGGQAGIVNIVMKKERRIGYNGSIRAGTTSIGGYNAGGNINVREGKVNVFLSANLNQRRGPSTGETFRQNLFGNPPTNLLQASESIFTGQFLNARGGIDWFMDNRNTLTFTGSITRGKFLPEETLTLTTDSLFSNRTATSEAIRQSMNERMFRNMGGSILYKHLYPKAGKELTADLNINRVEFDGNNEFMTTYLGSNRSSQEQQISNGGSSFFTAQIDYVDPLAKNMKLEMGTRAAIRQFSNDNFSYLFNSIEDQFVRVPNFADQYEFDDQIYAAYASFSHEIDKWGYQIGLRAESSQYTGLLPESQASFENNYPFSLFPSVFLTRKLNKEDNLQLSYTRRINRPSFFQLMPFTDFSDSLNLRRGNPNLLPEFTNSFELTYQNIITRGHDILVSAYYKQATDLITSYQTTEFSENLGRDVLVISYANSNSSIAYGVEFTSRNTLFKGVELTSNINLYNSRVDASNVESDLVNEQFTWFIKENLSIRLPAKFRLQVSGQYQSKTAFSPSSGGRFRHWRGVTNTAQGYTKPYWFVDLALRRDFLDRKLTLSLSMRDVFRSRKTGTYTESDIFIQDSWRLRAPQVLSANLSYRFGKPDVSLFKRKNNRMNTEGMELMN